MPTTPIQRLDLLALLETELRLTSDKESNSNQDNDDIAPIPDIYRVEYGIGIEKLAKLSVGKCHKPNVKENFKTGDMIPTLLS